MSASSASLWRIEYFSLTKNPWASQSFQSLQAEHLLAQGSKGKMGKKELRLLFDEVLAVVADPSTAQRSLPQLLELSKVLHALVHVFSNAKHKELSLAGPIDDVRAMMARSVQDSLDSVVLDAKEFFAKLWHIKQSPAKVLSDLSPYHLQPQPLPSPQRSPSPPSSPSPIIVDAPRFIEAFKSQMRSNFERFEDLPLATLKRHIGAHAKALALLTGALEDGSAVVVASAVANQIKDTHVRALKTEVSSLKDELLDMIIAARSHITYLRDLLEDKHVYSFTSETLKLVDYFERHGARLDSIFKSSSKPSYPLEVPMFTLLQEGSFTLSKSEDLDAVRSSYFEMCKTLEDTRSAYPDKWPQTLPNLSTHDTLPLIGVRALSDFKVVMVAYNEYLEALLSLADRWSVTLRLLFELIEFKERLQKALEAREREEPQQAQGLGALRASPLSTSSAALLRPSLNTTNSNSTKDSEGTAADSKDDLSRSQRDLAAAFQKKKVQRKKLRMSGDKDSDNAAAESSSPRDAPTRRTSVALFERNESFPETSAFADGSELSLVERVADQVTERQYTLLLNSWDYLSSLPSAEGVALLGRSTMVRWRESPSVAHSFEAHSDEELQTFVRRRVQTLVHCFRLSDDSEAAIVREAARNKLLLLDADSMTLFTAALVPSLLDVIGIDSSTLEKEVQSAWTIALSALNEVLVEEALGKFAYKGPLLMLMSDKKEWRQMFCKITLTHVHVYKDATYKKRTAQYSLAEVVELRYPPLRAYCLQVQFHEGALTFSGESRDWFSLWDDEFRWRLALVRTRRDHAAAAKSASAAMLSEAPTKAYERVSAIWKRVISLQGGFDTFVSALFKTDFMIEWQVLFDSMDDPKKKQFVYGFVRFLLQQHDPVTLRQHMSKRGAMYEIYGFGQNDYVAFAASLNKASSEVLDETSPENAKAWNDLVLHFGRLLSEVGAELAESGMRAVGFLLNKQREWSKFYVKLGLDTLTLFHNNTYKKVKSLYPLEGARASLVKVEWGGRSESLLVECDEPPYSIHLTFESADETHAWLTELTSRLHALQRISGAHEVIEAHKAAPIDEHKVNTARKVWRAVMSPATAARTSSLQDFARAFFTTLGDEAPISQRLFAEFEPDRRKQILVHMVTFLLNAYLSQESAELEERGGHYALYGLTSDDFTGFATALVHAFQTVLPATLFTVDQAVFWRQMVLDLGADIQRAGSRTSTVGKTGTLSLLKSKLGAKEFRKVHVRLSLEVLYVFKAANTKKLISQYPLRLAELTVSTGSESKGLYSMRVQCHVTPFNLVFAADSEVIRDTWANEVRWRLHAIQRAAKVSAALGRSNSLKRSSTVRALRSSALKTSNEANPTSSSSTTTSSSSATSHVPGEFFHMPSPSLPKDTKEPKAISPTSPQRRGSQTQQRPRGDSGSKFWIAKGGDAGTLALPPSRANAAPSTSPRHALAQRVPNPRFRNLYYPSYEGDRTPRSFAQPSTPTSTSTTSSPPSSATRRSGTLLEDLTRSSAALPPPSPSASTSASVASTTSTLTSTSPAPLPLLSPLPSASLSLRSPLPLRVALLGATSVGKSALVTACHKTYGSGDDGSTVFTFDTHKVELVLSASLPNRWGIARILEDPKMDAALLLVDVTSVASLKYAENIVSSHSPQIPVYVAMTKLDLPVSQHLVLREELSDLSTSLRTPPSFVSLTGDCVGLAAMIATLISTLRAPEAPKKRLSGLSIPSSNSSDSTSSDSAPPNSTSGPLTLPSKPSELSQGSPKPLRSSNDSLSSKSVSAPNLNAVVVNSSLSPSRQWITARTSAVRRPSSLIEDPLASDTAASPRDDRLSTSTSPPTSSNLSSSPTSAASSSSSSSSSLNPAWQSPDRADRKSSSQSVLGSSRTILKEESVSPRRAQLISTPLSSSTSAISSPDAQGSDSAIGLGSAARNPLSASLADLRRPPNDPKPPTIWKAGRRAPGSSSSQTPSSDPKA